MPTLVDDGVASTPFVLTESLAVLLHVAAKAPEARLGASEGDIVEQARLNEIMAELVSDVHKAFTPIFVPDRFVVDPEAEGDVREAAFALVDKAFARLEARLDGHDWLVLDRRTVADAYLNVVCRWKAKTPTGLEPFPNLVRHKTRLAADTGVRRALAEEGLPAD
ncbi:MAG: glutathione S-transferase [Xanthobacteraceae bacterium]|nr:glutathione S-transferase [Xanthobacteraceae bacterium]